MINIHTPAHLALGSCFRCAFPFPTRHATLKYDWTCSFPIQVKQETDKSAAVATVVAAVDMARVREPVISAVEQTAQRTTTAAVRVQPAQEQVGKRRMWGQVHVNTTHCFEPWVLRSQDQTMSNNSEGRTEPSMTQAFRTSEITTMFKLWISQEHTRPE